MNIARSLLVAVGLGVVGVAHAQGQAQPPDMGKAQLQAFIGGPYHRALLTRALEAIQPSVFVRCPGLVSDDSQVTIYRPLAFAPDGKPVAGSWREAFPVRGCGNDTTINIYFSGVKDSRTGEERVTTILGLPGTTRADPTLQHDAVRFAMLGAAAAAKTCEDFVVTNTSVVGQPPPVSSGRTLPAPWRETWALLGCGRTFDVPLDFTPDGTGTGIGQRGGVVER